MVKQCDKKLGIDHNLGTGKINQQIIKTDDSVDIVNHTDYDSDDEDDRVAPLINSINKQPSTIGSSHDLKKATAIIVAAVVGYMMFR